jgi:spore maturation protein CgeB
MTRIMLTSPGRLRTVPMGGYLSAALRHLGHEVTEFSTSPGLIDRMMDRAGSGRQRRGALINRRFRKVLRSHRPDLVISLYGRDLDDESCSLVRELGVTHACWWLNDPFQLEASLALAHRYDAVFSNCAASVDRYLAHGVRRSHWLPTACEPSVHRPESPTLTDRCDVCFAGDWSPVREEFCEALAGEFDLRILGPWRRKLRSNSPLHARLRHGFFSAQQMARAFAAADVVLNLHSWHRLADHGTNPRLFEAAGCAACQVVDWKREIPQLFDCEQEVATFRTLDQARELIRSLLADPGRRKRMAESAQVRAYSAHTYAHRAESLLSALSAAEAGQGAPSTG